MEPFQIWSAVNTLDESDQFIMKGPHASDDQSCGWPLFKHELEMQQMFKDSHFIRTLVDVIPQSSTDAPMMVLQAFEKTLWSARMQRPMGRDEIKWIMKAVLLGLWTIHRKGLVYSDLKPENIVINGFENAKPGDVRSIIARLADCGAITKPSNREITSITYRSPEVYFKKPWTSSTDIWSWGIMYLHLLEAQVDLASPGIYDSICQGSLEQKATAVRSAIARDFDLCTLPYYADDESRALLPIDQGHDDIYKNSIEGVLSKGVALEDVQFLMNVLNPNPEERWSAADIIGCGYLELDVTSDQ